MYLIKVNRCLYLITILLLIATITAAHECSKKFFNENTFVCVCNSTYCDSIEPLPNQWNSNQYILYTSTQDGLRMQQTINSFKKSDGSKTPDITINRAKKYQTIIGFGGAMTDSAGINIKSLPKPAQDLLMRQYFGDGSQYTIIRVPIGGTDFSTHKYTLDDTPYDTNLDDFKLAFEDTEYKIPLIHEAKRLSKMYPIKLMSACWTAPAYMKTNNKINEGGVLLPEYYQTYADYLTKFLQAYEHNGLDFDFISSQNEPVISSVLMFNSMTWSAKNQSEFTANNLGPTLEENGFDRVKVIIVDDQRPFVHKWVTEFLLNANATKYISGVGVHWYLDYETPAKVLTDVHNIPGFENKFIIYTEACASEVKLGSWESGTMYLDNIIDDLNNWATGWIDWNLALNLQGGPNWVENYRDSPIIVNATGEEFYKNPMYYAIAHVSKYIPPSSARIDMINNHNDIKATAFETPENKTVIVLLNNFNEFFNLSIENVGGDGILELNVPPNSFMTIIY